MKVLVSGHRTSKLIIIKTAKEVAEVVGMTPIEVRMRYSKLIKRGIVEAIPKEFSNH